MRQVVIRMKSGISYSTENYTIDIKYTVAEGEKEVIGILYTDRVILQRHGHMNDTYYRVMDMENNTFITFPGSSVESIQTF